MWEKYVDGRWVTDTPAVVKAWTVDAQVIDGVVRWRSNNRVPPQDCLDQFAEMGFQFDMAKSQAVREADFAESSRKYREAMANYVPSEEDMFEMEAAFGPGVEVVDVLTGRKFRT